MSSAKWRLVAASLGPNLSKTTLALGLMVTGRGNSTDSCIQSELLKFRSCYLLEASWTLPSTNQPTNQPNQPVNQQTNHPKSRKLTRWTQKKTCSWLLLNCINCCCSTSIGSATSEKLIDHCMSCRYNWICVGGNRMKKRWPLSPRGIQTFAFTTSSNKTQQTGSYIQF